LTPQADAAVPADVVCGDDPGPDEPEDPALRQLYQQIGMMPLSAEDWAAAEPRAAEAAREQEERERACWKEQLDQERRQQLEELARRNEAFAATRRGPPDRGGHDPAAGREAGRAPPEEG
jgi:hypothetical protein